MPPLYQDAEFFGATSRCTVMQLSRKLTQK